MLCVFCRVCVYLNGLALLLFNVSFDNPTNRAINDSERASKRAFGSHTLGLFINVDIAHSRKSRAFSAASARRPNEAPKDTANEAQHEPHLQRVRIQHRKPFIYVAKSGPQSWLQNCTILCLCVCLSLSLYARHVSLLTPALGRVK